jgi:hypothetical protein
MAALKLRLLPAIRNQRLRKLRNLNRIDYLVGLLANRRVDRRCKRRLRLRAHSCTHSARSPCRRRDRQGSSTEQSRCARQCRHRLKPHFVNLACGRWQQNRSGAGEMSGNDSGHEERYVAVRGACGGHGKEEAAQERNHANPRGSGRSVEANEWRWF